MISDEIVELGWRTRHRTRPDHPVRLICVEAKPHESDRGMRGPDCDGVLRLVTNRLELPAELIVEIQSYCAMIVCMLILISTGEKPNRAMYQMVWYSLIGLASLKELEAFIASRKAARAR
ncbi:MAG: hypothetical protein EBZ74_02295 [Planctomycetia bacterium]|nr:hypothetical protein [Planctomycetia bacterium]